MPAPKKFKVHVTEWNLKRIFNFGCYIRRQLVGQLTTRKSTPGTPIHPELAALGYSSYSMTYHDKNGRTVARVHFYETPTGVIAASGLPDPKEIYWYIRSWVIKYSQHGKAGIAGRNRLMRWLYETCEPYDRMLTSKSLPLARRLCAWRVR